MPHARPYWTCQFAGWGFYAIINALIINQFAHLSAAANAGLLTYAFAGIAVTHLLRYGIQRTGLIAKPWQSILWQTVLAIPLGAFALTVLILLLWRLLIPVSAASMKTTVTAIFFTTFFNMHFLIALWLAIYITVHLIWSRFAAHQAQLTALQAQTNPHFLFNSLNGLRGLILEDPHAAQGMVTRLAQLLRYSLNQSQRRTVSLGEELDAVRDYLAIEQIRFEDRLQVCWHLDPALNQQAVPPMSLQTLVENALKHGIATQPAGGEVRIDVQVREANLYLEVTSPGQLTTDSKPGTGLRNLKERLQLLYGKLASLELVQKGNLVVASISLPCVP